jgi:hypothetical protein
VGHTAEARAAWSLILAAFEHADRYVVHRQQDHAPDPEDHGRGFDRHASIKHVSPALAIAVPANPVPATAAESWRSSRPVVVDPRSAGYFSSTGPGFVFSTWSSSEIARSVTDGESAVLVA